MRSPPGHNTKIMARNNRTRRQRVSGLQLGRPRHKVFKPDPNHPRCPVTGKLRYATYEAAENILKRIIFEGHPGQAPHRSYRCPHCDGYHHSSHPRYPEAA